MPDASATESPDVNATDRRITTLSLSPKTRRQLGILKQQWKLRSISAAVEKAAGEYVRHVELDLSPAEYLALQSHRKPGEEDLDEMVWRVLRDHGYLVAKADEEVV